MGLSMNKKKFSKIFQLLSNDIAEFFPYFFVFYLIALIVSALNESWHLFFYWPAFHFFIVLFALIAVFSENVREPIYRKVKRSEQLRRDTLYFFWSPFVLFAYSLRIFFYMATKMAKRLYLLSIEGLTKKNIFRVTTIIVVLAFVLYVGTGVLDSITIFYALVAIFFLLDLRISAWATLILLAICSIALVFKKNGLAEISAIYAYYFLIITVVSQIKEVFLDGKSDKI